MDIVKRVRRHVRWSQRQKLPKLARSAARSPVGRRALALVHLLRGRSVAQAAEAVFGARSTVYAWVERVCEGGLDALFEERRGASASTLTESMCRALDELLSSTPQSLGYLRSRWSSELLATELKARTGVAIHASTVRRALSARGWVWRRARPTLHIADPRKAERMAAIEQALSGIRRGVEVFYVDEADIALNPRIGAAWRRRGAACQEAVPTPGKNHKAYLAGALHAHTGRLLWVGGERKNATLFITLLAALERGYPKATRLVLILDNYAVHRCRAVAAWLAKHPRVELLFQPAYHPWVNRIERLWKAMHDTVTRNHRCKTLAELCRDVARFLEVVQPFPGAGHGCARRTV